LKLASRLQGDHVVDGVEFMFMSPAVYVGLENHFAFAAHGRVLAAVGIQGLVAICNAALKHGSGGGRRERRKKNKNKMGCLYNMSPAPNRWRWWCLLKIVHLQCHICPAHYLK
jgi:hypothetical protein